MLPMGTIMAVSMLLGVLLSIKLWGANPLHRLPVFIQRALAVEVLLAGLWNVLWYASQHLGEFWGNAALVSGTLLILTSLGLLKGRKLPHFLQAVRPLITLLLAACCGLYGYTIYHL